MYNIHIMSCRQQLLQIPQFLTQTVSAIWNNILKQIYSQSVLWIEMDHQLSRGHEGLLNIDGEGLGSVVPVVWDEVRSRAGDARVIIPRYWQVTISGTEWRGLRERPALNTRQLTSWLGHTSSDPPLHPGRGISLLLVWEGVPQDCVVTVRQD